ncbi:hypothetical protein GCM10008955_32640 [Deinococcus malanensis]|uniref:Ankyrin repeat domain-containing protein n=1 Tax=Deinococcus malanensis TaxID=1706855 RepID=A0ABQ2F2V8_9DEIO|nr:hypothetical protein [Deinococcus malanensis]GGK36165.1 hypothetical protein GCM10008955_32640 [Deinococcus malanensis]
MTTVLDHVCNGRWLDVRTFLEQSPPLGDPDASALLAELCYHGQPELVVFLLTLGANPDVPYHLHSASPHAYDLEPGTTAVGQTILGSVWGRYDTLSTLEALLSAGADANLHTFSGYTPLQLAIAFDRPAFAEALLRRGADPYRPSTDLDRPDAFVFAQDHPWARALLSSHQG